MSKDEIEILQQWIIIGLTTAGFIAVWIQIRKMAKDNIISSVAALLQIESVLGQNMERIDRASTEAHKLITRQQNGAVVPPEEFTACQMEMKGAVQNYLNSVDRLCSCILRGIFRKNEAKEDYRDYINSVVETYATEFDIIADRYHHIRKVRELWKN